MSLQPSIPVLDLKDFLSDSSALQKEFIQKMGQALQDLGFFSLDHHGVDMALIEQAYALMERFFNLPDEIKHKYEKPELIGLRGLTGFGKERAKNQSVGDLKEFWHVGREFFKNTALKNQYAQNIWIEELPEFKDVFLKLYTQLETCASHLMRACAIYIGESEDLFSDMIVDGDTVLRLIHYPEVPVDAHPASLRAASHEDINFMTLLCEATDAGLELLQHDGQWRAVHAQQGQLVIDTGDMMQNLTNGLYKSTTHRVVNPDNSHSKRFSMPFFVHARADVDVTPLASCVVKTGGKAKFESLTAGEFLMRRLRENGVLSD